MIKKTSLFIGFLLFISAFLFSMPVFSKIVGIPLGSEVPDFKLLDLEGKPHQFSELKGKVVMIHFWSATCPYVIRYNDRLNKITSDYAPKGVMILGINSNVNETAGQTAQTREARHITYPIWMDSGNEVADLFGAVTTPHVFIIDEKGTLVYRGALDDQGWSKDNPVTKNYANEVLDAVLSGKQLPYTDTKTAGCTVKRKKG